MLSFDDRRSCGNRLRDIRKERGINSPSRLSQLMSHKYSVSGILKRERGEIKIDLEYITDYCLALRIKGKERVRLIELTKLFLLQFDPWQQSKQGVTQLQLDFWKRLLASDCFFEFQNSVICGILQSEEYRYEILRSHGVNHVNASMGAKQRFDLAQALLASRVTDSSMRLVGPEEVRLVVHENALYQVIGSSKVIADQIEYMMNLNLGRGLELRILPREKAVSNIPLMYSFSLFDNTLILMEAATGAVYSANAESIERVQKGASSIFENSLSGQNAKTLLLKALAYHSKSNNTAFFE